MLDEQDNCDLCRKDRKGFDGLVWYSGDYADDETNLCRSCYLKWGNSKESRFLKNKYKNAKPRTKLWSKMCDEEQKAFNKWFKENK